MFKSETSRSLLAGVTAFSIVVLIGIYGPMILNGLQSDNDLINLTLDPAKMESAEELQFQIPDYMGRSLTEISEEDFLGNIMPDAVIWLPGQYEYQGQTLGYNLIIVSPDVDSAEHTQYFVKVFDYPYCTWPARGGNLAQVSEVVGNFIKGLGMDKYDYYPLPGDTADMVTLVSADNTQELHVSCVESSDLLLLFRERNYNDYLKTKYL